MGLDVHRHNLKIIEQSDEKTSLRVDEKTGKLQKVGLLGRMMRRLSGKSDSYDDVKKVIHSTLSQLTHEDAGHFAQLSDKKLKQKYTSEAIETDILTIDEIFHSRPGGQFQVGTWKDQKAVLMSDKLEEKRDNHGRTEIFDACKTNNLEKVKGFIAEKRDVFIKDNNNQTPLEYIWETGVPEATIKDTVQALLDAATKFDIPLLNEMLKNTTPNREDLKEMVKRRIDDLQ